MQEVKTAWWDYFSITILQFLGIPLSILSVSVTTRLINPDEYGVRALFFSVIGLLFLFGINWTSSSVIRFGKEEFVKEGHLRKTFGSRLLIATLCYFLSIIIAFLFRAQIMKYIGLVLSDFWLVIVALLSQFTLNFTGYILKTINQIKLQAFLSFLSRIVGISLLILIILHVFEANAKSLIIIAIISNTVLFLMQLRYIKLIYLFPLRVSKQHMKKIVQYSWALIFAFSTGYIVDWVDIVVIRYYLSLESVGIYGIAYNFMLYFSGLLSGVTIVTFPLLSASRFKLGEEVIIQKYIKRFTPQVVFAWVLLVCMMMLFSRIVFSAVVGQSYQNAVYPFMILISGIGFQAIAVMYTSIYSSFDLIKYSSGLNVLMGIVNLAGDLLLVPRIGINGAAITTAFAYIFTSYLYLIVANKLLKITEQKALFYPIGAVLSLLICYNSDSLAINSLGVAIIVTGMIFWARATKLFSFEDLSMFSNIDMPIIVRKSIEKVYLVLSV